MSCTVLLVSLGVLILTFVGPSTGWFEPQKVESYRTDVYSFRFPLV